MFLADRGFGVEAALLRKRSQARDHLFVLNPHLFISLCGIAMPQTVAPLTDLMAHSSI
jgi:hypothetical protein